MGLGSHPKGFPLSSHFHPASVRATDCVCFSEHTGEPSEGIGGSYAKSVNESELHLMLKICNKNEGEMIVCLK